jgi:hypothetical protein
MRRREFLGALGGAAASQFVARASKPSKYTLSSPSTIAIQSNMGWSIFLNGAQAEHDRRH